MDTPMLPTMLNGHVLNISAPPSGSDPGEFPTHFSLREMGSQSTAHTASVGVAVPDPQMTEKAKRRKFSASYKRRIVEEADECVGHGSIGALLRREGLYASTLTNFRRQDAEGLLESGMTRKPRASKDPALAAMLAQRVELERDNRQLRRKLAHAEKIIAIQKKAAILLGETLQDMSLDEID